MTPTLDTSPGRKMLSHSTGPIVLDNGMQKKGAAEGTVDAWLVIRTTCILLKAVPELSSAPL